MQGLRPHTAILGAEKGGEAVPKSPEKGSTGPPTAHLGHLDPAVYHPRPVLGCHARIPEAGGDDEAGHPSELVDCGLDGGGLVLNARFVLLLPGRSQALRGHHLPEELLGNRGSVIQPVPGQLCVHIP